LHFAFPRRCNIWRKELYQLYWPWYVTSTPFYAIPGISLNFNKAIYGTSVGGESGASSFRDCQALCASNPSCVACDFNTVSLNCSNYRNGNDKTPPVSNPGIDSAISPPCLTLSDKCGDLDHEIRVYNGVAYTFYCGYQLGYGNVKPTFQTPNLLTCISKCSTTPGCQGVNYPIKGIKMLLEIVQFVPLIRS
jgi:hypothetical protein